jgi:hypothetical protein
VTEIFLSSIATLGPVQPSAVVAKPGSKNTAAQSDAAVERIVQ